jgi:uncharacterized protein (TIGR02594 family)
MTPYEHALKHIGTYEWAEGDNPKVLEYYKKVGRPDVKHDSVPWCAAFFGAMLVDAGLDISSIPVSERLLARAWLKYAKQVPIEQAQLGDGVVLKRGFSKTAGHIGFFAGWDGDKVRIAGGNQRDSVNVSLYSKASIIGVIRLPSTKPAPHVPTPVVATGLAAILAALAAWFSGLFGG